MRKQLRGAVSAAKGGSAFCLETFVVSALTLLVRSNWSGKRQRLLLCQVVVPRCFGHLLNMVLLTLRPFRVSLPLRSQREFLPAEKALLEARQWKVRPTLLESGRGVDDQRDPAPVSSADSASIHGPLAAPMRQRSPQSPQTVTGSRRRSLSCGSRHLPAPRRRSPSLPRWRRNPTCTRPRAHMHPTHSRLIRLAHDSTPGTPEARPEARLPLLLAGPDPP